MSGSGSTFRSTFNANFFESVERAGRIRLTASNREKIAVFAEVTWGALEYPFPTIAFDRWLAKLSVASTKLHAELIAAISDEVVGEHVRTYLNAHRYPDQSLETLITLLSLMQQRIALTHPAAKKQRRPKPSGKKLQRRPKPLLVLDHLIWHLAEVFESAGRRASASEQKSKGELDTPFLRFTVMICDVVSASLTDRSPRISAALKPSAIKARAVRVLDHRRRGQINPK